MRSHGPSRCLLAVAILAPLLGACAGGDREPPKVGGDREAPKKVLLEEDEAAVASPTLIALQERPTFPVDAEKRPFAMLDDQVKKAAPGDAPRALEESRPQKAE
jgi:hypothetical protein